MRNKIINRKIKRLQAQPRIKALKEFKDVKRIAMLFDAADYEQALAFKATLEAMGKVVRCWTFAEVESPEWVYTPQFRFLTRHHLNFCRLPKAYIVDDFKGFPADMLMNLSQSGLAQLEYLAMLSPSDYRVSFNSENAKYYDFVLALAAEQKCFQENAESLLFYLKNLRLK